MTDSLLYSKVYFVELTLNNVGNHDIANPIAGKSKWIVL